jgi:hypothetical protein
MKRCAPLPLIVTVFAWIRQLTPIASPDTGTPPLMLWIAPSEKDHDNAALEKRLCHPAELTTL